MNKRNLEALSKAKRELSAKELKKFNSSLNYFLEGKCPLSAIEDNIRIFKKHIPNLRWIEQGFNENEYLAIDDQLRLTDKIISQYEPDSLPKEIREVKQLIKDYKESIIRNSTKYEKLSKPTKVFIPFKEPKDDPYGSKFVEEAQKILQELNSDRKKELEEEKKKQIILDSIFHGIPEYEQHKNRKQWLKESDPYKKVDLWSREYIQKKMRDKELISYILEKERLKKENKKSDESLSQDLDLDELTRSQLVAKFFIKKMKEDLNL